MEKIHSRVHRKHLSLQYAATLIIFVLAMLSSNDRSLTLSDQQDTQYGRSGCFLILAVQTLRISGRHNNRCMRVMAYNYTN